MSEDLQIVSLSRTAAEVRRFLKVPYAVYEGDPYWVAPLMMDLKQVFEDRNPFFQHAEMQLWVARRGGADVGRIAGIVDRTHNELHGERTAFFGFFESVNDSEVSAGLFQAVFDWARSRGMQRLLGPVNPSLNEECGLLVDGFDSSPVIMMPYNPRYYMDLIMRAGFVKTKDLLAFHRDIAGSSIERLDRIVDVFRRRQKDITIRPLHKATLKQDLQKIKNVYNAAWERNWAFVPMTDAEIDFMAARLKPLLLEGIVWLAETREEPIGFLLALPDFNEALKPLRGRLLTPRLLGFLPYAFGWKRPRMARVLVLGVKAPYRNRGIESVMLAEALRAGYAAGFQACEASWTLEDNVAVNRLIETLGARIYKTYRIYERAL
jgi:GNAT superfamily N-acetyltransferase